MEKTDIVVFGAGGMGREVMWMLESSARFSTLYNILGFVDDSEELQGTMVNGKKVVGDTSWLLSSTDEIAVAVAIGNSNVRKTICEKLLQNQHLSFPNIIADGVNISDFIEMGKGCIICPGNILTVNITIGDFFLSNIGCTIFHDAVIGDFVTLNPSVTICGNVTLGDCTNIGVGTKVVQGKSVGEGAVIGAGAAIVRDIPANCTAVGVPAKPIKFH